MKITKTKLREMIKEELNEISGTRGGSANIERLRKLAADMRTKLAAKGTKEKGKETKQVTKKVLMLRIHKLFLTMMLKLQNLQNNLQQLQKKLLHIVQN